MADIFLSYSRDDRAAVEPLAEQIAAAGYTVWWDRQLTGGKRYLEETEAELNAAKVVLVVWSKTSIASHWVADEAGAGRDTGRLLPISLDGSMPPLGFRQFQVIDFSKWTRDDGAAFRQLTGALGKLTAPSGEAHAAPAPKKQATAKPILKQPLVLGGIALAAVALIAVIATTLTGSKPSATDNARTAFFGLTATSSDPLVTEIATNATEETFTALRIARIETAARGDTMGIELKGQLDKATSLGARYALGGEVRASGDQVSVNVRLDDAGTRATLWEQTLTGGAAQRESLSALTAGRASSLLACLIDIRPDMVREDASALAIVTRACEFEIPNDRQWVALWRDVAQVAPESALTQGRLSFGWLSQSAVASDAERPAMLQEVRTAFQRMQAIDPDYPAARALSALVDIANDLPLADALSEVNAAFQAADARGDRWSLSRIAITRLAILSGMGRSAEAARLGRMDSADYAFASATPLIFYARVLWNSGQRQEAVSVLDSGVRRTGDAGAWGLRAEIAVTANEDFAPILAAAPSGVSVETAACWRDVAQAVRTTNEGARSAAASRLLGCVRAGAIIPISSISLLNTLGQVDAAFGVASQAIKRSNPAGLLSAASAAFNPASRPMRADPRFLPLMKQAGIYQYWLDTDTQPDVCEAPEEREFEVCRELRKDQAK